MPAWADCRARAFCRPAPPARRKLIFSGEGLHLHLYGVEAADLAEEAFEAGARIGVVPGDPSALGFMRVQLCTTPELDPPAFAASHQAGAWRRLCPSPSPILGFDCDAALPDAAGLLERRRRHYARPQKNYYRTPPQIERGWKEHLFDVEGRAYLDMVNNVTPSATGIRACRLRSGGNGRCSTPIRGSTMLP